MSLAIRLVIDYPPAVRPVNIVGLMKVVIDGAVASLHTHDGTDLDEVTRRLSERLSADPVDVARQFSDPSRAVLGQRRLVWRFRDFVQWNPADDRLVRIELTAHPSDIWRISGSIHPLPADGDARLQSKNPGDR